MAEAATSLPRRMPSSSRTAGRSSGDVIIGHSGGTGAINVRRSLQILGTGNGIKFPDNTIQTTAATAAAADDQPDDDSEVPDAISPVAQPSRPGKFPKCDRAGTVREGSGWYLQGAMAGVPEGRIPSIVNIRFLAASNHGFGSSRARIEPFGEIARFPACNRAGTAA